MDKDVRLHQKVDTLTKLVTKNSVVLEEHQRRSLANENRLNLVEQFMFEHKASHVTKMSFIKDISIVLGIILTLLKLFNKI